MDINMGHITDLDSYLGQKPDMDSNLGNIPVIDNNMGLNQIKTVTGDKTRNGQ